MTTPPQSHGLTKSLFYDTIISQNGCKVNKIGKMILFGEIVSSGRKE